MNDLNHPSEDWFIKLFWNLNSYATLIIPLLVLVYLTKHKLCFSFCTNSALVKLIVYGKEKDTCYDIEQSNLTLIQEDRKETEVNYKSSHSCEHYQRPLKFVFCFVGLHASYLIWGLSQEKIMTTPYTLGSFNQSQDIGMSDKTDIIYFKDAQFLVLINRLFAFVIAMILLVVKALQKHKRNYDTPGKGYVIAPLYEFVFCSLSNVISSWCQYEALKFVNFPTQVLSKSCKVPSVMLMSRLIMRRQISYFEYLCSITLSMGMVVFLFGNHQAQINSKLNRNEQLFSGFLVLSLYLVFDSFTSNWEEKMYSKYKISTWQLMAAVNFYSISFTFFSLIQQGDFIPSLLLISSSSNLLTDCICLSLTSTIGQYFVFFTISNFGALIFSTIMLLRQIFSVIISYLIYGHSLSIISIIGIIIVFSSLLMLRVTKIRKSKS